MKTKLKMEFEVNTELILLNEDNINSNEKKTITLVVNEEEIMKILFRFSSSEPFAILDTNNNPYMVFLGFDKDDTTQLTFIALKSSDKKNYMISNYPDFILDLVEAFVQIHSIGKVTALNSLTMKMNENARTDDNTTIEETDLSKVPDEFELPGLDEYEDDDNEYDRDYYFNDHTPFDNKDTDYSESNDF